MKTLDWTHLDAAGRTAALQRPTQHTRAEVQKGVRDIIADVRARGDEALRALTHEYDGADLERFEIDPRRLEQAFTALPSDTRAALERAHRNIHTFHEAQRPRKVEVEVSPGIRCWREPRPIQRVGLYVPGGTAPLPSTVLMLGVPSSLAGCPVRVLCTPPDRDGNVDPHILAAAHLISTHANAPLRVFTLGGAQAVAAMAYGTESVPKVDKIFGPGNPWVTEAKIACAQDPAGAAQDLPAGPSEVLVLADGEANPSFVAADLLSQAEHGADSHVVLVCLDAHVQAAVLEEVERRAAELPRAALAQASLAHSVALTVSNRSEALEVINTYAPEHLILQVRDAASWTDAIVSAGSVFIGPWTPESVGDYASGTNHVLPTYGYARSHSGLSVESFCIFVTFQSLTEAGLRDLGPAVETLAEVEGLHAHKHAVSVRLKGGGS